jgi:hypothetical protein
MSVEGLPWRRSGRAACRHIGSNDQGSPRAEERRDIPLLVSIDGRPSEAHSTYSWSGGGAVLTLSTVLPERGLAAELISTYVGHSDTPTIATHLMLGPVGQPASIATPEHAHKDLDPVEGARDCAYDHANRLMEFLGAHGSHVSVELDERSFSQLERVV